MIEDLTILARARVKAARIRGHQTQGPFGGSGFDQRLEAGGGGMAPSLASEFSEV